MAGVRSGGGLERAGDGDDVASLQADAEQLVACADGHVAETGGPVVAHPFGVEMVLEDEVGHLDLQHERSDGRVLGAKEQTILAIRFRVLVPTGFLGEVAVLDGQAKTSRARTVESQRARGGIATADGTGKNGGGDHRSDRKDGDEDDSARAHDGSSTQGDHRVNRPYRSGERWRRGDRPKADEAPCPRTARSAITVGVYSPPS